MSHPRLPSMESSTRLDLKLAIPVLREDEPDASSLGPRSPRRVVRVPSDSAPSHPSDQKPGIITQISSSQARSSLHYLGPAPPDRRTRFLQGIRRVFHGAEQQPQEGTELSTDALTLSIVADEDRPPRHTNMPLVSPQKAPFLGRKCMLLDLDETLVHSSFDRVHNPDYLLNLDIAGCKYQVSVLKRPGVDAFLRAVCEMFEVYVFTASLAVYADPLMDLLDPTHLVAGRLFREHCTYFRGNYIKDMHSIGRPLSSVFIIDNSPVSYAFDPEHAVPVETWLDDPRDTELSDLLPFLELLRDVDDVRQLLHPDVSLVHKYRAANQNANATDEALTGAITPGPDGDDGTDRSTELLSQDLSH